MARWILGPEMNLQVPPNLTERYEVYLDAGINDWGGVSPLTIDWVQSRGALATSRGIAAADRVEGLRTGSRLPVYPEYMDKDWIDPELIERVRDAADHRGYARRVLKEGVR